MKYVAFISYSHADEAWGRWLHKALEGYRIPARLVGQASRLGPVPKRLFPVFRDRDELASSHELGTEIEAALKASRSLIVICSPNSARSRWVNEEVRAFKAMGKADRVLCLIVDGEPGDPAQECFAPAVRCHLDESGQVSESLAEPIAADARPGKDGKQDALLKLAAGVLGLGFDELKRRDLAAKNRRLKLVAAAASLLAVVLVGLSSLAIQARNEAVEQRRVAQARQSQAEGLIQYMLGDLRGKLEPLGKLDLLTGVGEQALDYFASVAPQELSDVELKQQATAIRQIGEIAQFDGDIERARQALVAVIPLNEELVARHPGDPEVLLNLAKSLALVAAMHTQANEHETALQWNLRQAAVLNGAADRWHPDFDYRLTAAESKQNLAVTRLQLRELGRAEALFSQADAEYRELVATADTAERLRQARTGLAGNLSWQSYFYTAAVRKPEQAEAAAREQLHIQREILAATPGDRSEPERLLTEALLHRVYLRAEHGSLRLDDPELTELLGLTLSRIENDPTNINTIRHRTDALGHRSAVLHAEGRHDLALELFREELALRERILELAPDVFSSHTNYYNGVEILGMKAWLAGTPKAAHDAFLLAATRLQAPAPAIERLHDVILRRLHVFAWLVGMPADAIPDGEAIRARLATPEGQARMKGESGVVLGFLLGDAEMARTAWAALPAPIRQRPFLSAYCEARGGCEASG